MNVTDQPTIQNFHIEGVKHILCQDALVLIVNNNAILIDVREEYEVKVEHIPLDNVFYHPMSVILDRLAYISKNQNIIIGCPMGIRSTKVANLLVFNGYKSVANLDGGFNMWKQLNFSYTINNSLNLNNGCSGCSCTCNSTEENTEGGCC
jgi:rhodanese-related sulfurtransferase